jgi:hypothetical protein
MKSILLLVVLNLFYLLDNNSFAQSPDWLWAKSAGGVGHDCGNHVAVDGSGNVCVSGWFSSIAITFGSFTLTNAGNNDMFIVKYDADGNVIWAKSAGGTADDAGNSVTVDNSGYIYVSGWFYSPSISFGSNTLYNADPGSFSGDIFLVKYDANGNVIWARSAGDTGDDLAANNSVDDSGNLYITGIFASSSITFGSITLMNTGNYDMFIVKYDANGNVIWAKSAGGINGDWGYSVSVSGSGNMIYVTGYYDSPTITFGTYTLTNAGNLDMFIVCYDGSGTVVYAKSAGGISWDTGTSVATDASGNAWVIGSFMSPSITFGTYTLTNASMGFYDLFLVKYDASGNVLWAESTGGTGHDFGNSVMTDATGNAYITGSFRSLSIIFGSYTLMNTIEGNGDVFLVKYNGDGNVLWVKSAGGICDDDGWSVAVDNSGNSYVTGSFYSPTIIFGSDTLLNSWNCTSEDMFVTKSEGFNVGINEIDNSKNISIFPNPADGKIILSIPIQLSACSVRILNTEGQELLQQSVNGPNTAINVSSFRAGIYFVKVTGEQTALVKKFIKK